MSPSTITKTDDGGAVPSGSTVSATEPFACIIHHPPPPPCSNSALITTTSIHHGIDGSDSPGGECAPSLPFTCTPPGSPGGRPQSITTLRAAVAAWTHGRREPAPRPGAGRSPQSGEGEGEEALLRVQRYALATDALCHDSPHTVTPGLAWC
ncbi:hypothetical protein SKAU_G00156360 [Synaphobranchus kaupii]|uniref:Uncharacterized protein n=1 Tax=Synaphobranchus kaupii TaxID=118154 RepID=A0A9Q1FHR6_SYNKA|nr:hypothetical protein SKAU_G00156360 [Synaphobranchus kaupii]